VAGILFLISAPSGSGKSTLVSELRKQLSGVDFAISWTTRAPRGSEENGREYYFTTRDEFEQMVKQDKFLEHAEVFGNLYGTARQSLEEARSAGHDLLLDIDVQGAAQVRAKMPEAVSIFVLPPNPKVLRTRLRNRSRAEGVVNESELYRRLSEASKEIENFRQYGYILVNDILGPGGSATGSHRAGRAISIRNGEAIAYRSRRVLEVAAACMQSNSQERLKPVLEAFGILGDSSQPELNFEDEPDELRGGIR
jgi:guanylate kinase